jgi:hypothetical protein
MMAKTPGTKTSSSKTKPAAASQPKRSAAKKPRPKAKPQEAEKGAPDLISEFLESPLVADTLAAGAAAALAVFVQRGLSRRDEETSSKQALKRAGKAAAAAMGQKLADEFDAMLAKAKAKREEG